MAELYLAVAGVIRRLDLELFDTHYERDVKIERDCFVGLPRKESRGVRVQVNAVRG